MHDVAKAAGVHQTTVSRALRNDRRLPRPTRLRIQRIAEKMGYRPHPLVSALIALRRARHPPGSFATIAYLRRVEPSPVPPLDYLPGIRAAAEQQGYVVEVFPVGTSRLTEGGLNRALSVRNLHAVILAPLPEPQGSFALDWEQYCTVAIEYTFTSPAFDRVVHDNFGGMRRIMQECRRRELGRIGLVLTAAAHERTERAHVGAYWSEQKSGRAFAPIPPLLLPAWSEPVFTAWFRRHRPEVIVTSRALEAEILAWAAARRLRLGRNLHLVNVNATPRGEVSGIFQNPFAIGSMAARTVIEKVINNDRGPPAVRHTILTSGTWIEGSTLRPLPARKGNRR